MADVSNPINLLDQTFQLNAGEKLAYKNNSFYIVKKNATLEKDLTTSLKVITSKVNELVKRKNLETEQVLNLKLNCLTINNINGRVNAAITKKTLLNILDKILFIITFGLFRLKFNNMKTAELDRELDHMSSTVRPPDQKLTVKLINFLFKDLDRVLKLHMLMPAIARTNHKLSYDENEEKYLILNHYLRHKPSESVLKICGQDKFFETISYVAKAPKLAPKCDALSNVFFQDLSSFEFKKLDQSKKDLIMELAPNFSKHFLQNFNKLFKQPECFIAFLEHTIKRSNKLECIQNAMSAALSQFDKLTPSRKSYLFSQVNQLLSTMEVDVDISKISPSARLEIFKYINHSKNPNDKVSRFSYELFHSCIANFHINYMLLSKEEKILFFPLLQLHDAGYIELSKNSVMLFDLMEYLGNEGMAHHHDIAAIRRHVNQNNLSDKEKCIYLKFLGAFDLISKLSKTTIQAYEDFLAKNVKLIEPLSSAAYQICLCMEKINRSSTTLKAIYEKINLEFLDENQIAAFIKTKHFLKDPHEFLKKINFSKVNEAKFKAIIQAKDFDKKDDIYLAKATPEQLDIYYAPKEKKFVVNKKYPKVEVKDELKIPPLPKGVKPPDIGELLTLFDAINFTNSKGANYSNSKFFDDNGKEVASDSIRLGIQKFINFINARQFYTGVPPQYINNDRTKPNPDFIQFFDNVKLTLQHIVLELRKLPPNQRIFAFEALGTGGSYCGMRHKQESRKVYGFLTGFEIDVDENLPVEDMIYVSLKSLRLRILTQLAQRICSDVHFLNATLKYVGPSLELDYDKAIDIHEPPEWAVANRKKIVKEFLKWFYEGRDFAVVNPNQWFWQSGKTVREPGYTVTAQLNLLDKILNNPLKTKKQDYRDKIIDALKAERKKAGLDDDASDYIIFGDLDFEGGKGFKINRQGLIFLMKSFNRIS